MKTEESACELFEFIQKPREVNHERKGMGAT